jgi:hypothetical protein
MRSDPARVALVVAGILALNLGDRPTPAMLLFLAAIPFLLAASFRWNVRVATLLLLLVGAVALRAVIAEREGSDVLDVTSAAIGRILAGLNPYGVGYVESTPDGSPFPYGPFALLWYLPLHNQPDLIELGAAVAVIVVLAVQGRIFGLAVYATMPVLVATAVDGSNDTSLGLLLLGTFMVAPRWPLLGAVALAAAVGFKLSGLAFVPAFLLWGGPRVAAAFATASLVVWAPVVAQWGIGSFLRSAEMAEETHKVTTIWSLGSVVRDVTRARVEALDQLRFVLGGVTALVTLPLRRSLDGVVLAGSAVYLVTLFAGNWATFAYFAGLGPLICWRLDDWLGVETTPLVRTLPFRTARADEAPV